MEKRKLYKKILSMMLAAVLCVSTWTVNLPAVQAGEGASDPETTTMSENTGNRDLVTQGLFTEQFTTTISEMKLEVNGEDKTSVYITGRTINLSSVDTNQEIKFSLSTGYEVNYGKTTASGEEDAKSPLSSRNLCAGDYFEITGIPNALQIPENITGDIMATVTEADGTNSDKCMATMSTVTDDTGTYSLRYTLTEYIQAAFEENGSNRDGYSDIKLSAGLEFTLNPSKLEKNADGFKIVFPNGTEYTVKLPGEATTTKPTTISKSGNYNDGEITWTITVGDSNKDLADWQIAEELDTTYQELQSIKWAGKTLYMVDYSYDKDGKRTVTNHTDNDNGLGTLHIGDEETTTNEDGSSQKITSITYAFADDAKTSDGVLVIKTRLNDAAEKARVKTSGTTGTSDNWTTIKNNVSLQRISDDGTFIDVGNANDAVDIPYIKELLKKEGKQISADVIEWTITVNPSKARIWSATVTDVLQTSSPKLTLVEGSVKVDDDEIGTKNNSVYYTYNNEDDNNKLSVYFPYDTLTNTSHTITFQTTVEASVSDGAWTNHSETFTNTANIECEFPTGTGTTHVTWDTGEVECKVVEHKIIKTGSTIDNATGNITWTLKPSCLTNSFSEAVITDYVGEKTEEENSNLSQLLQDTLTQTIDKDSVKVTAKLGENATETKLEADKDYKLGFGDDNNKITITLFGEKSTSTGYKMLTSAELNTVEITYQTHADGWGITQDSQTYYNTATLKVDGAATVYDNAETSGTNNMLTKGVQTYYHESDGSSGFQYTITVNSDKVNLKSAVLTDDLAAFQQNLSYIKSGSQEVDVKAKLRLNSVTINGSTIRLTELTSNAAGSSTEKYQYIGADTTNGTLGTLKLDLADDITDTSDSGQQVTIVLDVLIANSKDLFRVGYTISGKNTASLATSTTAGTTGSAPFTASVGSDDGGKIVNDRVKKEGDLNPSTGVITYTITINPWAADMGTVTLKDVLDTTYKNSLEYDYASFTLYKAKNDGSGVITQTGEAIERGVAWNVSLENDADGKRATVNIYNCTAPYKLTYDVELVGNASGSIANSVTLYSNNTELETKTYTQTLSGWSWGTGTATTSITINKVSCNPAGDVDGPLAGATFGLYKVDPDADNTAAPARTAVSDSSGRVIFNGLSSKITYYVKEISARRDISNPNR